MGFRFWRRFTILPGLRLNLSGSGVSLSAGVRGASVTLGKRGTYANLGLPGTGISYRTRLDATGRPIDRDSYVDSPPPDDIDDLMNEFPPANRLYHPEVAPSFDGWTSIDLLRQRARDAIDWQIRVSVLTQPDREMDDDEFDAHARAVAAGMLARRVVDGDRDAWGEVLAEELRNEQLPFDFSLDFELETDTGLRLGIQLPTDDVVGFTEPVMQARAEYEDVCCAFLLRIVHEAFRVLPDLVEVVASGYRIAPNPATGRPYREVLLHFATDRLNFSSVQWDAVDPSAAFEALGGASRKKRGELRPIATDDESGAGAWLSRR